MTDIRKDYPEYAKGEGGSGEGTIPGAVWGMGAGGASTLPPMDPEPTLRDYFAMSALTGLITEAVKAKEPTLYPDLAKRAFQLADYMLIERDKT